ncbi:hypothetical protein C8Q80DRAFT_898201 [Daedaleopsis nitida]|nr:hypothetical protein C8Q80DRAFT_898201 [Daedaleopsis nitida]
MCTSSSEWRLRMRLSWRHSPTLLEGVFLIVLERIDAGWTQRRQSYGDVSSVLSRGTRSLSQSFEHSGTDLDTARLHPTAHTYRRCASMAAVGH